MLMVVVLVKMQVVKYASSPRGISGFSYLKHSIRKFHKNLGLRLRL
jgi:hypothetical protein